MHTMSAYLALVDKFKSRQAKIGIIGLGYVGLPLAVAFAEAGFCVVGIDKDETRVKGLRDGQSHIPDIPATRLAALVTSGDRSPVVVLNGSGGPLQPDRGEWRRSPTGCLSATTDHSVLSDVDVAIICVPTPLSKTKDPDLSCILAATEEIAQHLHPGMLIVLESTTYPGTTEEIILPSLQHANGLTFNVGMDFFLAFSPERIDPGRADWTLSNTPKVIGGVTSCCLETARALYECVVQQVVPVSSPKLAEMVKLLENTFRLTNIALVNEIAIMCDRLGVDVWEVIDAAKTKPFGFMPFYPGPGLGGHCIPVDPQYLAWKLKTLNYNARFIQLAAEINLSMPAHVLGKIADGLNEMEKPLKGSRVLVLGVAYKEDVGDLRESPAIDLIRLLREKGAEVAYHDPYVPRMEVEGLSMVGVNLNLDVLRRTDCVVITTSHKSYDWKWIAENSCLVVDTRNALGDVNSNVAHVVKL